jgi:XisH protein
MDGDRGPAHPGVRRAHLYVDLGLAEPTIAATQAGREIAVEIQSFVGKSVINDLHRAVGQCLVYQTILDEIRSGLPLYLAVPEDVYRNLFTDQLGQLVLTRLIRRLVVFDAGSQKVIRWIN